MHWSHSCLSRSMLSLSFWEHLWASFVLLCVVGDLLLNGSSLFAKDMYALLFERDVMSCAINGMVIA